MSGFPITPDLQALYTALVPFILTVTGLPAGSVIQGLQNRAAMPLPGFIVVQAVTRHRLRTNLHNYAGAPTNATLEEGVEVTMQIDCYGSNATLGTSAEDWASILSATLRDEYGCTALAPTLQPLYADDAKMVPLVAGEDQYEERWMLEAHFQYNPVTTIPQQSANVLGIKLWDVPTQEPY